MGIKDYVKFVKKEYNRACKRKWLNRYTHLYIDLNHALHRVCYQSNSPKEILSKIKSYINDVMMDYRPTQEVYIGADGPAPIAKMILQRKRRYDKVKQLKSNEELNLSKNLSLNFTPGTEFMLNLSDELKHFSSYLSIVYGVKVDLDIETDDEGEVKIRRKIEEDQMLKPNLTAIVYSGDADMILLLMSLKRVTNIYQIIDKNTILSFGQLYNIHCQKFCHNVMGYSASNILAGGGKPRMIKKRNDSIKNDYIFINLLFGNDYLPKIHYLKFEYIWKAYSKYAKYYPSGLVTYDSKERILTINRDFMFTLINETVKQNKFNYDKKFSFEDIDHKLYDNYMKGVAWCFDMYATGVCADYRYIYDHSKSPHYTGLLLQIMFRNTYVVPETKPINSDLYGILLIPEKAKPLLSDKQKELSKKLVKLHPIIYEEERCQKCSIFSKSLSTYNKQAAALRSDSTTESDLLDLNIVESEECDDDSEECDDDSEESVDLERRAELKSDLLDKIRDSNFEYSEHKKTHDQLTLRSIEEIERSFAIL
jgi:5'-3' exoribonuclease Xrn1-like protein